MPKFNIRAWESQTIYDEREHVIEAETPEAAAAILRGMIRDIDNGTGTADWPHDADGQHIRRPDPREIIDGESGFVLLTAGGAKVRDVDPGDEGEG